MRSVTAELGVATLFLVLMASASNASASSLLLDDFSSPATANVYSGVGLGNYVSYLTLQSPTNTILNINVASSTDPVSGPTTVTLGDGALTFSSPTDELAYVQIGFGFKPTGNPMFPFTAADSIDATPYNYVELSFNNAIQGVGIGVGVTLSSPVTDNYLIEGVNAAPATNNSPFNVYVPIPQTAGFDKADVGAAFIDLISGSPAGDQWSLASISLTSGVPEPAAWAMMLIGLGAVGAAMRMRRRETLVADCGAGRGRAPI